MPTSPLKTKSGSKTDSQFDVLYKRLNKAQKQAVDSIEGPVMVIAGPGTGKTQILALRIANILKQTDTAPENVLALTFTESGVHSMRARLLSIIGSAAYKIPIFTFHSFANHVIKSYPDEFPRIIGSVSITDIDQIRIIKNIIDGTKLAILKPYGDNYFYIKPILNVIKNLKREAVSPADFKQIVTQQQKDFERIPDLYHEKGAHKGKMKGVYADLKKKIEKNQELIAVYKAYEYALVAERLYDYEDMIIETIRALEHDGELLLKLQEEYQYVLADEHQDANKAQNTLLKLLSGFHDNPNLFIVGDEKQAIFRFQGASLDNFLFFKELYPETKVINLTDNYRSTQSVLDGSHSLIEKNRIHDTALRKRLVSAKLKEQGKKIVVRKAENREDELRAVIADIEHLLQTGSGPEEIAVIYRENRDAGPLISLLENTKIPYTIHSDRTILGDSDIQKFVLLLKAIYEIGNDELIAKSLYIDFLGVQPLDAYKLITHSNKHKQAISDLINDRKQIEESNVADIEKIVHVGKQLSKWATMARNMPVLNVLEKIVHESGFLSHLLNLSGAVEKYQTFEAFFNEARKLSEARSEPKLSHFLEYLELLETHKIMLKSIAVPRAGKVNVMTAHKSKGLEFEHVFIIGANDGHWGNKREIAYFHIPIKGLMATGIDPMEDERRLMYVALTRAKRQVTISYSTQDMDGRELFPTQFISEIDPAHIEHSEAIHFEKSLDEHEVQNVNAKPGLDDRTYLRELFMAQGLTVTALNAYLKCPWNYFFNNLLRLPRVQEKHQRYGTAVHNTLKVFFDRYRTEEDMNRRDMLKLFEQYLGKTGLTKPDYADSLEKGQRALGGYYDTYYPSWPRAVLTEYSITKIPLEVTKGTSIVLRGNLDKLEFVTDEQVTVVDYKTGAPKSRNHIMGATKHSDGDYFRQLIFYKLLLDGQGKYEMAGGTIDFIEPDERGKYKKEYFEISETDTENVKAEIRRVAGEIVDLAFWDATCNDKQCEYCRLRKMIRENR